MKTVEQRSPVQYSPRGQSMWVLADYGGKDLWNRWVLSLEWNSECVIDRGNSNRHARPPAVTNPQTGPITIHCDAAS